MILRLGVRVLWFEFKSVITRDLGIVFFNVFYMLLCFSINL
jgi:hypothetical protein